MNIFILNCVFFVSPFCDALTGFLVLNGYMNAGALSTPSQLIKFFITLLLLLHQKKYNFYKLCLLGIYCVVLELVSFLVFQNSFYQFLYGVMQFYKVVYLLTLFYFLKNLVNKKIITFKEILDYMISSGLMYAIILVCTTLLGVNTSTYTEGTFGSKGVFASGNGLSVYLGFSSALGIWNSIKYKNRIFTALFLCIASTLVGTKASIVFLFLNLGVLFYHSPVVLKLFIFVFCLIVINYISDIFIQVFDVIIYRYKNSENIFTFLASSRDSFVIDAFKQYDLKGLKSLRLFFGSGAFVSFRSDVSVMNGFDTLENDFFDILFMYGIIVLSFYLMFQIRYCVMAVKIKQYHLALVFFCICFYSLWAGHSVFNSMSGTGLAVVPVLIYSAYLSKQAS